MITLHDGPLAGQQLHDPPTGVTVIFGLAPRDEDEREPPAFHRYKRRGGSWIYAPPAWASACATPTTPKGSQT